MSVQALWRGFDVNFDKRLLYCKCVLEVDEEHNRDLWFGIKFILSLSLSLFIIFVKLSFSLFTSKLILNYGFFLCKCEWFIIHSHCFRTHKIHQAYNQILPVGVTNRGAHTNIHVGSRDQSKEKPLLGHGKNPSSVRYGRG